MVTIKANMDWSPSKLNGTKTTFEETFSNETWSKSKTNCEDGEVHVNWPKVVPHLQGPQPHVPTTNNTNIFFYVCQMLMTPPNNNWL